MLSEPLRDRAPRIIFPAPRHISRMPAERKLTLTLLVSPLYAMPSIKAPMIRICSRESSDPHTCPNCASVVRRSFSSTA